jgi:hypothetical protein
MDSANTLRLALACIAACACSRVSREHVEGTPAMSVIIFRDSNGRVLTSADLQGFTGKVRWEVIGTDAVPIEAKRLHDAGRQAGGTGDYARAVDLLRASSARAPGWPYPVYDLAFTYLVMGQDAQSLAAYERVDAMAPRGFFTAKTAVDSLRKEAAGKLPKGIYLGYVGLEWVSAAEKQALASQLVQRCPEFAPGWKVFALQQGDDAAVLRAIERGLSASPDPETLGMLLINKAMRLNALGKRSEAKTILGTLALDPNVTLGTESLAKATLAGLIESER